MSIHGPVSSNIKQDAVLDHGNDQEEISSQSGQQGKKGTFL